MPLKMCLVFQLQQASGQTRLQLMEPEDKQESNRDITLGNSPRHRLHLIYAFMALKAWRSVKLKSEPTLMDLKSDENWCAVW